MEPPTELHAEDLNLILRSPFSSEIFFTFECFHEAQRRCPAVALPPLFDTESPTWLVTSTRLFGITSHEAIARLTYTFGRPI